MSEIHTVLDTITSLFEENRNPTNAIPMQKYMKNHFPFLGIKTPLRRELMKQVYVQTGILKVEFQETLIEHLWEKKEREYQYAAIDYTTKSLKKLTKQNLPLMENIMLHKQWWDSIDGIAPNAVGTIAKKDPSVLDETIEKWAYGQDIWLRRAAILFQLKYKETTEEQRLYRYIIANADSKEFFIQKAIGWALREYSKTNPDSVRLFIQQNSLSRLSIREGSKYI